MRSPIEVHLIESTEPPSGVGEVSVPTVAPALANAIFALTELSNQPSPAGALRVCLIFVVLFWMYAGYVLLTNQVPPVSNTRRLPLIAGMAGFLVYDVAIPRAFADTGLVFGLGYLILVLVHAGLYAQVHACGGSTLGHTRTKRNSTCATQA